MERRQKTLLVSGICLVGAVIFLAMTVFPFQYGPIEAAALAVAFVAFAVFETVLDDTSF